MSAVLKISAYTSGLPVISLDGISKCIKLHPLLTLNSSEKAVCRVCSVAVIKKLMPSVTNLEMTSKTAWVDYGFS